MKLLVDTHCWLWYLLSPEKLNREARGLLQNPEHEFYLSVASAWEIVIKYDLGKLEIPLDPAEYIPSRLAALGYLGLPISLVHVLEISRLPAHHKDPFDRILIAQARVEKLQLLTADSALELYDAPTVWAGSGRTDQREETP